MEIVLAFLNRNGMRSLSASLYMHLSSRSFGKVSLESIQFIARVNGVDGITHRRSIFDSDFFRLC